ncbi:MAG: hypothetical protein ACI9J3_003526, partial [Parvicellaceae bacterium]
ERWLKIELHHDSYQAWICQKQWLKITQEDYDYYSSNNFPCIGSKWTTVTNDSTGEEIPVSYGALLPRHDGNGHFKLGNQQFTHNGDIASLDKTDLIKYAQSLLNTPYLWGGRGSFGIDCSGFSQLVYRLVGEILPRDAYQQAELGETIQFVDLVQVGDLVFFDNEEGRINHVGIVLKKGEVIHASGRIRIDKLDHQGIFAEDSKSYTHNLRIIKRIF